MPNELTAVVPDASGPHYDEDFNELNDPEEIVEKDEEVSEEQEEEVAVATEEQEEVEEGTEEEQEPPKIPFSRPSIKDIKTKYPDFFKDFPDIKEAIFREAKFTGYFPTVDDAKEAFDDNEAFVTLSNAALAGDSAPIIDSLSTTDPKALKTFAASFLPNLYKKDQEAYSIVVTPVFENLFRHAYKTGDENMKNSVLNLAEYMWPGDGEDSVLGKKTLSQASRLLEDQKRNDTERETRSTEAFRTAAGSVSDSVSKSMRFLVTKDFDPEGVFTSTVKKMLVEDIVSRIDKQLVHDEGHVKVMGARWKRARTNGYTEEDKSKLISTYLARAKSLIPTIREQVRSAALGKSTKAADNKREKVASGTRQPPPGRPASGRQTITKDYSKMTDREILDS